MGIADMKIIPFVAGTLLAAALSFAASAAEQTPSQTDMKNAVQAYFDAMNEGDPAKVKAMFAADAMIEDPLTTPLRPAATFVDSVLEAKLTFNVLLLTATPSNVATAALYINTPNGGLNAVEIFTFNPEGKITGMKAYWGTSDRAAQ